MLSTCVSPHTVCACVGKGPLGDNPLFVCLQDPEDQLPAGPLTFDDLQFWAEHMLPRLAGEVPESTARLASHFGNGIWTTTHYSGLGTVEACGPFLTEACSSIIPAFPKGFKHYAACEMEQLCRTILAGHRHASRPSHIFGNIMERVPIGIRSKLEVAIEMLTQSFNQRGWFHSGLFAYKSLASCLCLEASHQTFVLAPLANSKCLFFSPR